MSNNNLIESDIIISNVDVNFTYKNLIKQKFNHRSLKNESSSSALIFYWGIKGTYDKLDLHNIFFLQITRRSLIQFLKKNKFLMTPLFMLIFRVRMFHRMPPKVQKIGSL